MAFFKENWRQSSKINSKMKACVLHCNLLQYLNLSSLLHYWGRHTLQQSNRHAWNYSVKGSTESNKTENRKKNKQQYSVTIIRNNKSKGNLILEISNFVKLHCWSGDGGKELCEVTKAEKILIIGSVSYLSIEWVIN